MIQGKERNRGKTGPEVICHIWGIIQELYPVLNYLWGHPEGLLRVLAT